IDTEAEGLAPEEIERQITFPIENEMNGISGVTHVQSESKFGLSVVTVYFTDDTDIYFRSEEIERQITFPIENEMNGISGVTHVQSESKFGLSVVTVYFTDDTDIYF